MLGLTTSTANREGTRNTAGLFINSETSCFVTTQTSGNLEELNSVCTPASLKATSGKLRRLRTRRACRQTSPHRNNLYEVLKILKHFGGLITLRKE